MDYVRRFLFHTTFGSGAAAGRLPFPPAPVLANEPPSPLPDLATNLGRADGAAADWTAASPLGVAGLSPTLIGATVAVPLAARNVLLTDTDLKLAGFLTADEVLL